MGTYPKGRSIAGSFGFTTEYINRLEIIGREVRVTINRPFSPLPHEPGEITVRRENRAFTLTTPSADTLVLFLDDVFRSIAQGDWAHLTDALLADAREMDLLRQSAERAAGDSDDR